MTRILLLLCLSTYCYAQTPNSESLISVHNVDNVSTMNNISNPQKGHLIFVESTSTLYFYDGSTWVSTSAGGSGSADGDAWGVNGEDTNSPISRNGKVTIGTNGNLSEKLLIQNHAQITNLEDGLNLRFMAHYNDGSLASDQFRRYYNDKPQGGSGNESYTFLNTINEGILVTGHYESQIGCSFQPAANGHFQLRYYKDTNLFEVIYNNGVAIGNSLTISGMPGYQFRSLHCGDQAGVVFRANSSNELEVVSIGDGYFLNIKIKGY